MDPYAAVLAPKSLGGLGKSQFRAWCNTTIDSLDAAYIYFLNLERLDSL